jgi:hypothetical protein
VAGAGNLHEGTGSDQPAGADPLAVPRADDKRPWLGRLTTYLASFAGGAAVNDLSGTLGYHGLAGVIALLAVVTAATWIRGLDPRARLPRRAPWLFLALAACAATAAACLSGTIVGILTAAAVILTLGAVLSVRELQSAERLLAGAGLIVGGTAIIAGCTASIAADDVRVGTSIIPSALVFLAAGIAYIANRDALAGAAVITAGAALIMAGSTLLATNTQLNAIGNVNGYVLIFVPGVLLILEGPTLIFGGRIGRRTVRGINADDSASRRRVSPAVSATLAVMVAAAASGSGPAGADHVSVVSALMLLAFFAIFAVHGVDLVVTIGPRTIASWTRQAIDWATKVPQTSEAEGAQPEPDSNAE